MIIKPTPLDGLLIVQPDVFTDERGFFMESYQDKSFAGAGITDVFVQDNHSRSRQGTLRGLHYQIQQAQVKLVRVVAGEVYDVAVDLRRESATFGRWAGFHLSAENKTQLYIPKGFAHGFYVLSEWADLVYKVSDYYAGRWERSLLWNDAQLGIDWPLIDNQPPTLSDKDRKGAPLSEAEVFENLA